MRTFCVLVGMSEQKKQKRAPFHIEKVRNVSVAVYRSEAVKNGKAYQSYTVHGYSASGDRQRWSFANSEDAKAKALAVAKSIANGEKTSQALTKEEIENVCEVRNMIRRCGFKDAFHGAKLLFQAVEILGGHDELLIACQAWKAQRSKQPFTPKSVALVVEDFLARQKGRISDRRHRTNRSYLEGFSVEFGKQSLHDVQALAISDWIDRKGWGKRTRNDVLGTISLLYLDSIKRGFAPVNPASSEAIKRERTRGGSIGIFTPTQAQAMLSGIGGDLKPFLALWMWSGCRKEEISRLSWAQINTGLQSGSIYLEASQTKNGIARAVPICSNLRVWLQEFRKPGGPLLPDQWRGLNPKHQLERLDEIGRHISRKSKVAWLSNGPRHSFATYHLCLHKDPGETVKAMGTSLRKLEEHYWSRAACVTQQVAEAWFSIVPQDCAAAVMAESEQRDLPQADLAAAYP
jgi:integrase